MEALQTLRARGGSNFALADFELLTLALSALEWRRHNGTVKLVTDAAGAAYLQAHGLSEAWDGIEVALDGMAALGIDEDVFWAGAKLYALARQAAPCVMLDLDFIVWQPLDFARFGRDLAVIHREALAPSVYPPKSFFRFKGGWCLPGWLDWTALPCNGALVYFGSRRFLRAYTAFALDFMQHADAGGDRLRCMVFAEQRWMAMCAAHLGVKIHALSSLAGLFDRRQTQFTHLWGHKQHLRENPAEAAAFCRTCAARLQQDFLRFAERLQAYEWAARYMGAGEARLC